MLSEKIRELRRKNGLSQEELAEKLDVSRQAVSKWETGAAVPTADKLVELADFFGVSLDFLMRDSFEAAKPSTEAPPQKRPLRRKICGIFLIAAAVFTVIVLMLLRFTGNMGSVSDSSVVTVNGTGIVIAAAVICAVCGTALFISSKK